MKINVPIPAYLLTDRVESAEISVDVSEVFANGRKAGREEVIAAIRELHCPDWPMDEGDDPMYCVESGAVWPCETEELLCRLEGDRWPTTTRRSSTSSRSTT